MQRQILNRDAYGEGDRRQHGLFVQETTECMSGCRCLAGAQNCELKEQMGCGDKAADCSASVVENYLVEEHDGDRAGGVEQDEKQGEGRHSWGWGGAWVEEAEGNAEGAGGGGGSDKLEGWRKGQEEVNVLRNKGAWVKAS